jgi:putative oxidoreductase
MMVDVAMLVLRVALGLTVAAHGAQKLFGWFGGPGITGFAGFLESLGFRRAKAWSVVAGLAETGGGLLLAFGFLTPFAVAVVIGVMVAASVLVHRPHGFFAADGGWELPAVIATGTASVAIAGPGAYAVDTAMELGVTGPAWAAGAIVLGVVLAGVVVAVGRMGHGEAVGSTGAAA